LTLQTTIEQFDLGARHLLLSLCENGGRKRFISVGDPQRFGTVQQLIRAELATCKGNKVLSLTRPISDEVTKHLKEVLCHEEW